MRKLFLLSLALLASFNLWAYTAPAEGTYDLTSESTAKVNSSGRFIVISEGLYAYRLSDGYSYSSGNGLKTQSNKGGFVFCLNAETNVTFTIKHAESKNAHDVTVKIYSISEAQYKEFDDNKAAATKSQTIDVSGITPTDFVIAIAAETKDFTGTTTLSAGYYSVVPTGEKGNTYLKALGFELLPATDPVTEVTIEGPTKGPKDYAATFSATTDVKADSYQWFVNNVEQPGATAKTFNFTPTAVGDYSIVCKARNANNAEGAWIASDVIAFKALNTLFGELIKATLTSGSAATVTGIIGGTADVDLSSSKKMDNGKSFGITLASGAFQEGDTVVIKMTTAGQNYPCLFADENRTNLLYLATETSTALEYKIVLPAKATGLTSVYLSRNDDANYKWNPILSSMSVIRPMATKSTVEDLNAVTIDGNPFDPAALSSLKTNHSFNVEGSYVNAPKVKFFKEITITYEDDSEKVMNDSIVVTATENAGGKWEAQATINKVEYTITMGKATSHVVTYMFGTTELGTENVEVGGNPANYATYQTLHDGNLSTFVAWYSKSDLSGDAVTMASATITQDTTFYASFTYKYATSINFEKYTMENGKGQTNSENAIAALGTNKYASNYEYESKNLELDSLNNDKDLRNYAYLGLKVKKSGALLNFRLAKDATVKVKFGNVGTTPKVSINGGDYADMTITNKVYSYTAATEGELISIKTADANAVVFQQIAIGEELADPELFAISCAEAEHGSVTNNRKNIAIPGETVTLTVTPAGGYQITAVKYNDGEDHSIEPVNSVYAFTMPDKAVTVTAEFSQATALDNTVDELKAVKFFENGKLFIRRGDKIYDAQGAIVK